MAFSDVIILKAPCFTYMTLNQFSVLHRDIKFEHSYWDS